MHFVNWIDHTFEVLGKLADAIYKTDYKDSEVLYTQWKDYVSFYRVNNENCDVKYSDSKCPLFFQMVECVSELHVSIDELLLSAMTLCRYCLADDQPIVKARCQVVITQLTHY